jgi:prophage tail gpP-like protein
VVVLGCTASCILGCKPKASSAQCDQLLDRYAELVVIERHVDASAGQIRAEQERERSEARGDDAFKNCSSEVSRSEFDCAMQASSADALEKCLQ